MSATDDPLAFGVGARLTISIMSNDFISVILGALKQVDASDLKVETGDVSTYIGGSESSILRYLTDISAHIAESGKHASIVIHLFRGCPGAVSCEKPPGPRAIPIPKGRRVGRYASAEWALYPLADNAEADHMRDIYAAIDYTKGKGVFVKSDKSVTRLEGDLGDILEAVVAGWVQVGRSVQHVTSHLTISLNSPSHS